MQGIQQILGVNPSLLIGFTVANLISWILADYFIQMLYTKRFGDIIKSKPDQTLREAQEKMKRGGRS